MLRKTFEKFNLLPPLEANPPINVGDLYLLPDKLLDEAIREGELKVSAQFQSRLATEQRGYTILGLTLTMTAAAMAAYTSSRQPNGLDAKLAQISFTFAAGLFISTMCSTWSIWPERFYQPGNEPKNWLPQKWHVPEGKCQLKWAKVEQANALQIQIKGNALDARIRAGRQRASIAIAILTAITAAIQITVC